ncbi:pyrroline-5-carboxylate reductase [Candidatus Sumerlaeota bacterium]|nr:pyrroline-5-carboxylate reductase [Candidatus Sumerlaeota bacterium]
MAETPLADRRLAVIGCGNMATAIVGGLIEQRLLSPDQVVGHDRDAQRQAALVESRGITGADSNAAAIDDADIILLAVKPQNAEEVLAEIGPAVTDSQLIISILAGTKTALIESHCSGSVPVVRVMPNTPALVGCGAAALAPGRHAGEEHLALTRAIFDAVGISVELSEDDLNAVTGLSGSGPGYVFLFVEAMIQAGIDVGLSPRASHQLVAQTLLGSARLLLEDSAQRTPAELREAVTSPGGTTAAGLEVLRHEDFGGIVRMAIHAATERSRELGRGK